MFYSAKAEELRTFLKEVVGLASQDIGEGWLIFDIPEADMGVHPADSQSNHGSPNGTHDISFYCDDIEGTVAEMKEKGVVFKGDIEDHGYGFVTYFQVPGDFFLQLYQPKYS